MHTMTPKPAPDSLGRAQPEPKPTMNAADLHNHAALLGDKTPCHEIDTSGTAAEHALGDLARAAGHASLSALLNDWNAWSMTVAEVAEQLLTAAQE